MKKPKPNDFTTLEDLVRKIQNVENYVDSLDGQSRSGSGGGVLRRTVLHQDTEESTAEESAQGEQDNPEMWDLKAEIESVIHRILSK